MRRVLIVTVIIMMVGLAIWFGLRTFDHGEVSAHNRSAQNTTPRLDATTGVPAPKSELEKITTDLNIAYDPTKRRTLLVSLKQALADLPPEEATRFILQFLASGDDITTGVEFKIGADGFLTSAPTTRVFMLDQLGRINPAAAVRHAEVILSKQDSADEWAVALKYYAQGNQSSEGAMFLNKKLRAMWANDSWSQNPSTGYLEAFDVVVHLGGTDLIPDLAAMLRNKDKPSTGHAAYLTMDRLIINDATTILTLLHQSPEWMTGREQTRANYFARADLRNPDEQHILEEYLLNPGLSTEELQTFVGIFPNANYMVSHNLLTPMITPDGNERAARDRAALEAVKVWRKDPRFGRLKPELYAIQKRLVEFVPQGEKAPQ